MYIGQWYWSVFVTEEGRTLEEILAWCRAYADFLSQSPDRIGWCQKKADEDWAKYL